MRRENNIPEIVADMDAREAGLERLREEHDQGYRYRKAEYLRGRLSRQDTLAGETHSEWYQRWCAAHSS